MHIVPAATPNPTLSEYAQWLADAQPQLLPLVLLAPRQLQALARRDSPPPVVMRGLEVLRTLLSRWRDFARAVGAPHQAVLDVVAELSVALPAQRQRLVTELREWLAVD